MKSNMISNYISKLVVTMLLFVGTSLARGQQTDTHRVVFASSIYKPYIDYRNNKFYLSIDLGNGTIRTFDIGGARQLICHDDDNWSYSTYLVNINRVDPPVFVVLGMDSRRIRSGLFLYFTDGDTETSYRVETVHGTGIGQMVEREPR
jgi:hypothetical protein